MAKRYYPQRTTIHCPKCFATFPLGEYTAQGWTGEPTMQAHAATCRGVPTTYACGCPLRPHTPPFFARQDAQHPCSEHTT